MSIGSCHEILTEKLNLHRVATRFVPRLMTEQQKENRVDVCPQLLEQSNDDEIFIQKITTGDKAGFTATTLRQKFNHHDGLAKDLHVPRELDPMSMVPAHSALSIRHFCTKNQITVHLSYSPDLALCDFFLFPKLKNLC
uniref:Uncharacterized protein n=2 Tax=Anoplophora glabripennis TaxID=217634 RepID=V5I943_ANOGL